METLESQRLTLLIAGVDGVAEAVADEVDAEDGQEDHYCGRDPDPGAVLEHIQAARRFQHVSPTWCW